MVIFYGCYHAIHHHLNITIWEICLSFFPTKSEKFGFRWCQMEGTQDGSHVWIYFLKISCKFGVPAFWKSRLLSIFVLEKLPSQSLTCFT